MKKFISLTIGASALALLSMMSWAAPQSHHEEGVYFQNNTSFEAAISKKGTRQTMLQAGQKTHFVDSFSKDFFIQIKKHKCFFANATTAGTGTTCVHGKPSKPVITITIPKKAEVYEIHYHRMH